MTSSSRETDIRNDNPDMGTETCITDTLSNISSSIRNDNPDKGTETKKRIPQMAIVKKIRNDNPDKGTETCIRRIVQMPLHSLEMITPIRGRKLVKFYL